MKGCVLQKPKGSGNWYAIIERRDEATGKRIRKWYSLGIRGKKKAQIECARIITELKKRHVTGAGKDHAGRFL